MAITNYTELQAAIKSWLRRSDMDTIIPDLITLGEDRVYRNLRVRAMEASISGTMAAGVLAVPSDYVSLKHAYISSTSPIQWLERKAAEWMYRNDPFRNQRTAVPKYIAREGSSFIFAPWPAQDYTVGGIYYKRLDPVSTSVNAVFNENPGLWLFGALCESAPYIHNDKRLPMWEHKFDRLIAEAGGEEYVENASGGSLRMTADGMSHP